MQVDAAQATHVALWSRIVLRIQVECGLVAKLCPSVHNATRMQRGTTHDDDNEAVLTSVL